MKVLWLASISEAFKVSAWTVKCQSSSGDPVTETPTISASFVCLCGQRPPPPSNNPQTLVKELKKSVFTGSAVVSVFPERLRSHDVGFLLPVKYCVHSMLSYFFHFKIIVNKVYFQTLSILPVHHCTLGACLMTNTGKKLNQKLL